MELLEYLNGAVTPYHAVEAGVAYLESKGFCEQHLEEAVTAKAGGRYFVRLYGSGLVAYTVGEKYKEGGLFVAAAHTDAPCLRLKPKAELASGDYLRLDTELYGGAIMNTWLDRPLSVAGRVALRGKDAFSPVLRLVDFKRPLFVIPNLAIHMNREVNKGVEYKPQRDLLPLYGVAGDGPVAASFFTELLAKELQVEAKDILDYDLSVYCAEQACYLGVEEEFVSGPRLDNQLSCYALLKAIGEGGSADGISVAVLYDHEEIGSRSKQGADSGLLASLLERIFVALGGTKETMARACAKGFLLSVDGAHALHPNRSESYDPVNRAVMNRGVTLKINSSQRYAFDTELVAVIQMLCEQEGIPYQKFANHSDLAGGSTLGPIISSWLPMRALDLGVPMLAMHSARELAGRYDVEGLERVLRAFFTA